MPDTHFLRIISYDVRNISDIFLIILKNVLDKNWMFKMGYSLLLILLYIEYVKNVQRSIYFFKWIYIYFLIQYISTFSIKEYICRP